MKINAIDLFANILVVKTNVRKTRFLMSWYLNNSFAAFKNLKKKFSNFGKKIQVVNSINYESKFSK